MGTEKERILRPNLRRICKSHENEKKSQELPVHGKSHSAPAGRIYVILAGILMAVIFHACSNRSYLRDLRILSVGINEYEKINNLEYCVVDAQSMTNLFKTHGYTTETLTDTAATKSGIRNAISRLGASADASTVSVLYYSGHGTTLGGKYFIIPQDADLTSPTWIESEELASWIEEAGITSLVVILDACNSGGFTSTGSSLDASPKDAEASSTIPFTVFAATRLGDLLSANAHASQTSGYPKIVIASSGGDELSYESELLGEGHGLFTSFFLRTPYSADRNADSLVTATEAFSYVLKRFEEKDDWDPRDSLPRYLPHVSGGVLDLVLFGGTR